MKSVLELAAAPLLPGIVAAALLVAPARADVVTDWNVTTNALVAKDVGNNPKLRTLAMVHVAMSDAINTVQNRYTRVIATLPVAQGRRPSLRPRRPRGRSSPRSTRNRKPRSKRPTRHR